MGGGHLTVHKADCLGEETDLVPGCPGILGLCSASQMAEVQKGDNLYMKDPA